MVVNPPAGAAAGIATLEGCGAGAPGIIAAGPVGWGGLIVTVAVVGAECESSPQKMSQSE